MIFKSGYFNFAGVDSRRFDLILTSIDNIEESENRIVGTSRTVNSNKSGIVDVSDEEVELELQFAFFRNGSIITPSNKMLQEVERWLFSCNEPRCLSKGGIGYYLVFSSCNYNSNGYYTCKALSQPYCYTSIIINSLTIRGEKIVDEKCFSITGISPTIIEIRSVVDETVTITNRDKSFSINMLAGECIEIDSDNKEIISNKDGIYNRFTGSFIDLFFGINRVNIKTSGVESFCKVVIKHQDKLTLGTR